MRKLSLIVVAWLFTLALGPAQDQDFSKAQIKVTKVAGNVYMLHGAGGNIGATVGEDGIVVKVPATCCDSTRGLQIFDFRLQI